MPGSKAGIACRLRRAGQAALAAVILAAAMLAVGSATPSEARRKISGPEERTAPADLFGWPATAYPPARNFAKWNETIARYERERHQERALCQRGDCAMLRWREFLAGLKRAEPLAQLRAVNDRLNKIAYVSDMENYGVEDYWATPREFFAKGGDCEDYALAKYLSLRALGWPAERLRIVVVYDRERDLVHAALVAYHEGVGYLLDIEIGAVTDARRVGRYLPIFAISEKGWWSYNPVPADTARPAGVTQPAAVAPVGEPARAKEPAREADTPARGSVRKVTAKAEAEPALDPDERTEEIFSPGAK